MAKTINKNKEITFMAKVAEDLAKAIKPHEDVTESEKIKRFHAIMQKYGIAKGTWSKDGLGIIGDNFEWSMCVAWFRQFHDNIFKWAFSEPPKEIKAYGKKPKKTYTRKEIEKKIKA